MTALKGSISLMTVRNAKLKIALNVVEDGMSVATRSGRAIVLRRGNEEQAQKIPKRDYVSSHK